VVVDERTMPLKEVQIIDRGHPEVSPR